MTIRPMKILYVVNSADAQSIPLELGLRIRERAPGMIVAGYYSDSKYPTDHAAGEVVTLGAKTAFDRQAIGAIFRTIRREKPDVIHVHHAVSALFCWLAWLSTFCRGNLVKTEHNDHRFLPWHQKAINYLLYPFCARIICNSQSTQDSFNRLEKILAGKRSLPIYNGVDMDKVLAAEPTGGVTAEKDPDAPLVIGHVGRLVPQKNQVRLVRALARARAISGRNIRIEVIGGGALEEQLRATAAEEGVSEVFTLLGPKTRAEVYAALYRWDGFVMPSVFEGFCNALVEAMAAGTPLACSDIVTLREVAGPHAARFPVEDVEAMAEALIEIATQPRGLDRPFAIERYSMTLAVDRHLALYTEITA